MPSCKVPWKRSPDMDVVFAGDKNYLQHFAVALTSLLETNPGWVENIFFVCEDPKCIESLNIHFERIYGIEIQGIVADDRLIASYGTLPHISKATFYRLLLADLLPMTIGKILYLDSDLVVNGSLEEINARMDADPGIRLWAVDHAMPTHQLKHLLPFGFSGVKYFNAGVLGINLEGWRMDGMTEKFLRLLRETDGKLEWADQDILNLSFDGTWGELPSRYNRTSLQKRDPETPVVIHYTGSMKPWHYRSKHPYKRRYWHYLRKTPYRTYKYQDFSFRNFLIKNESRFLWTLRIGIKKYLSSRIFSFSQSEKPMHGN